MQEQRPDLREPAVQRVAQEESGLYRKAKSEVEAEGARIPGVYRCLGLYIISAILLPSVKEENVLGSVTGRHDSRGLDLNYSFAGFYFCAPMEFSQSFCASVPLYVEGSNSTYLQSKMRHKLVRMRRTCQKQVSPSDTLHLPLLTLV